MEQVEIEYIPEKAELYGDLDDEFRKVFEKFTFKESATSEVKRASYHPFTLYHLDDLVHFSLISSLVFFLSFLFFLSFFLFNSFRRTIRVKGLLSMQY